METSVPENLYPKLVVPHIQNPQRLWAFPILGIVIKIIILIPVLIWLYILAFAYLFLVFLINPFIVLFTGKYWDTAYNLTVGFLRIGARSSLYIFGLTDKYPGFSLSNTDPMATFDMEKPQSCNRFFAVPLLGGIVRFILLIPYVIYEYVISNAAWLGVIIASFPVLFKGRYPESVYEITRDYTRVYYASTVYFSGLSDKYPSFWISMHNQTKKVLLIIFGLLLGTGQMYANIVSSSATQGLVDRAEKTAYKAKQLEEQKTSPAHELLESGNTKLNAASQLSQKPSLTDDESAQIRGLINGAITDYQKATELDPQNAIAWYNLGYTYSLLTGAADNSDRFSIDAYKKAIVISPDYFDAYMGLGGVYFKLEEHENAIAAFQEATELQPNNANAWFNLGVAYKRYGANQQAKSALEKSLELLPVDDPTRYKAEAELENL